MKKNTKAYAKIECVNFGLRTYITLSGCRVDARSPLPLLPNYGALWKSSSMQAKSED
jgi:hypothetical protein